MLVALEEVFDVLRSERPLEPATALLKALVDDCRVARAEPGQLATQPEKRTYVIGGPSAVPLGASNEGTLVDLDEVADLLKTERPQFEPNQAAADLLHFAVAIKLSRSWTVPQKAEALVRVCEQLAALRYPPNRSAKGQDDVRAIIRDELSRAGLGTQRGQSAPFDPEAFREIVAAEVRSGVNDAGRDRWSAELLSKKIDDFLALKSTQDVSLKHREDVERRLQAFLSFVGDKAVRHVTRDDIKEYRDVLDQLPEFFEARLGTKDLRKALESNAKRKVPYQAIGPVTVDLKWLGPVNRLFRWLVLEEKIEKNPVDRVRSVQSNDEAANSKRLPFKSDQISRLFGITSKASPKTALYWLPILLLCTGARPNELAQLRSDDLKEFNGQPHLSVLSLSDRPPLSGPIGMLV